MGVKTRIKVDMEGVVSAGYDRARRLIDQLPPELHTVGVCWYPLAHARIQLWSDETGYSPSQIAAILANNNINRHWSASKTLTRQAIYDGNVKGTTPVVRAVHSILALPRTTSHAAVVPYLTNGSKTNNFYWSLLDIAGCPCDRWIFDIWRLPQGERYYPVVEAGIERLAQSFGLPTRKAQSLAWLARVYQAAKTLDQYMP